MGLVVRDVSKSFGAIEAVRLDLLEVPEGSICGLLGPNGAGKTTTMRLIVGTLEPDAGSITWQGQSASSALHGRIGYLPEERGVYADMTVRDQLLFFARINGLRDRTARSEVDLRISEFELPPEKRASELSKGNQQKLQLLMAIVHRPDLLVLDEPFTALDPFNNDLFRATARRLADDGTTILLSTHDMEEAEDVCDRIAFVDRGTLHFTGTVDDLRQRHALHDGKQKFLVTTQSELDERQLAALAIVPVAVDGRVLTFELEAGVSGSVLLEKVVHDTDIVEFRAMVPTLREIFLVIAGGRHA